jgi:hypothetical protein
MQKLAIIRASGDPMTAVDLSFEFPTVAEGNEKFLELITHTSLKMLPQ